MDLGDVDMQSLGVESDVEDDNLRDIIDENQMIVPQSVQVSKLLKTL